jgi:hypothetical protein
MIKSLPESAEQMSEHNKAFVRSCLIEIGHALSADGEIEDYETYKRRHSALFPIERAPDHIRSTLREFGVWLIDQNYSLKTVKNRMDSMAAFWSWCIQRGVTSPEQVQPQLVSDYHIELCLHWECSKCGHFMDFDSSNREAPQSCAHCQQTGTLKESTRFSPHTVRNEMVSLHSFFDWANHHRRAITQIPRQKIEIPKEVVRHYEDAVMEKLGEYITSPGADPTEALVLYLIIFHAFSISELRHAQMPTLEAEDGDTLHSSLADAYFVTLKKQEPSRGNHKPNRQGLKVNFNAEASIWLKPILERFEDARRWRLRDPENHYLLVATGRSQPNGPVAPDFVRRIVRSGSLHALNAICTIEALLNTAVTYFSDEGTGAEVHKLGWSRQSAFAFKFKQRREVQPQQAVERDVKWVRQHLWDPDKVRKRGAHL